MEKLKKILRFLGNVQWWIGVMCLLQKSIKQSLRLGRGIMYIPVYLAGIQWRKRCSHEWEACLCRLFYRTVISRGSE